ncbi:MAG: hypothetical protein AB1467_01720 [Candidatus Diapherotrites archaeon]
MVEKLVEELLHKTNLLHETVTSNEWKQFNRHSLVHALNNSIDGIEGIKDSIKAIKEGLESDPGIDSPNLEPLVNEYEKTLNFLRRNLAFEEEKIHSKKDVLDLKEKIEVPELYSALSEKILRLLLKTRFAIERLHLFTRREAIIPTEEKSTAKNLLALLRQKENEIQELKEKYESLRNVSFSAKLSEKDSFELEEELNEMARRMEAENALLVKDFTEFRKKIDQLNEGYNSLRQKNQLIEDLAYNFMNKSLDLVVLLKKERDYTKKIIMEIEHDTLKLRGAYSKELLHLNESKVLAKQEASREVEKKLKKLEEELKEKHSLLENFKVIAHEKEKKIQEMEKELKIKELKAHKNKK